MASFTYEIFPEKQAIVVRFEGHYSQAQVAQALEQLWSDPRHRRDYVGIADMSHASVAIDVVELHRVLDWMIGTQRMSVNRWAAVTSTPLATAIAMLFRRAVKGLRRFEVFSTWEAACHYIDVDLPPPPRSATVAVV